MTNFFLFAFHSVSTNETNFNGRGNIMEPISIALITVASAPLIVGGTALAIVATPVILVTAPIFLAVHFFI